MNQALRMYSSILLRSMIFNESNTTIKDETNGSSIYTTSSQSNHIKFGIFLVLQFLTLPLFLYIFYQYLHQRSLRKTIHYHIILLALFISFLFVTIALSLTQAYMFTSYVYPSNDIFCSFWNWLHYSLNIINLFLVEFASIERNILIFHANILRSKRGKVLFHYCPILFCLIYPPIFYMAAIFICPCTNTYDYTQLLCTWPCYFGNTYWSNIDLFLNNYTPLFTIPIFCTMIYVRVFHQRRSMQQQVIKWRRDRKLILQLWAISTLYLSMWMPLQIAGLVNLYWDPSFLIQAQIDYMYLFPYLIYFIYPFIVLFIVYPRNLRKNRHTTAIHPHNK
jgi:hypothetical protein